MTLNFLYKVSVKSVDTTITKLEAINIDYLKEGFTDFGLVAVEEPSIASTFTNGVTPTIPLGFEEELPVDLAEACNHGSMAYNEGTNSIGTWRVFTCSANECDPVWLY